MLLSSSGNVDTMFESGLTFVAALLLLALIVITPHVFGVVDLAVTVGALDGVAVLLLI